MCGKIKQAGQETGINMKIKHIIWDWNGTLLDDLWLSIKAINIVLKRYHLPEINADQYLEIFTFPVIDYYERLGFDFKKNPFKVVGTEFIEEYTKRQLKPALHESAMELITCLQQNGVTQSILSAARQQMLDKLIKHHDLQSFFVNVIGQDDHYAHGKTNAGKVWVKSLDVQPHEVLFVGDTLHDLDVAKAIGADCVLVAGGHTGYHRLADSNATVFRNLRELKSWLNENSYCEES